MNKKHDERNRQVGRGFAAVASWRVGGLCELQELFISAATRCGKQSGSG
jgi:hypothetical protein